MAKVQDKKGGCMGVVSRGPIGQVVRLVWFLLLCFILFIIGIIKGVIIGPMATLIFFGGIMAVVIGLWPVHVVVLYRSVAMTKKLGGVIKAVLILLLPIPLLLWPIFAAVGSILGGLGYGIGQPLVATFEAVGQGRIAKFYHIFMDGTICTLDGSCTVVRDFLDFTYHSILEILNDFRVGEPRSNKPADIKLKNLPGCILVGIIGVVVDVPAISLVALCKSPFMLYKGWSRLFKDGVGRQGPCLEAACVPFAVFGFILWPLVVAGSVIAAILCSPFIGVFGAIIVYQEMSIKCGLSYVVAILAEFDEYSNDVLHMQEGSCLPRPKYRTSLASSKVEVAGAPMDIETPQNVAESKDSQEISHLSTQKSFKETIQEVKLIHIMETMYKNMEVKGKLLLAVGVLKPSDIEAFLKRANNSESKIVEVGIPSHCSYKNLLRSSKSTTTGIVMSDGTEVTFDNGPKDRIFVWLFEPLLTIRDQLRVAHLQETEELYLEKLVLMCGNTNRIKSWDNGGVEPEDDMRLGELQAFARRIQGIATAMNRAPTHRRRFEAIMKGLYASTQDTNKTRSLPKSTNKSFNFRKSFRSRGDAKQSGSAKDVNNVMQSNELAAPNAIEVV